MKMKKKTVLYVPALVISLLLTASSSPIFMILIKTEKQEWIPAPRPACKNALKTIPKK
jgi:hypothetical protein